MIIGIDGNEANVKERVGIGEYSFELLKKFEEFQIPNIQFQIYLKREPLDDLPREDKNWQYRIIGPSKLWTQFALPLDLFFHRPSPDVFFTPTHYAPRFSPMDVAISIMDLSFIHFPELFKVTDLYQLKNWTAYSARQAKKIFTISSASKDDIIREYKVSDNKVEVTYPGIKKALSMSHASSIDNLRKKYKLKGDYILFVGTLQPRKNIVRLVEAFSFLTKKSEYKNLQLLIVGKKGWQFEDILNSPNKFDVVGNVHFLEFVSDEELASFYKNALCFVLPSLYEGFGLPVLEAMKYGCPVITSNVSSLPEAGGDAALYVDPEDVLDIAKKIESVLQDKKVRDDMIKKGYSQIKKFSWEKTARETLDVLEKITRKD